MAQCLRRVFQMTPNTILYQQRRFRGKINIQKPRAPHYLRQLVNEFLTPFYDHPDQGKKLEELCTKVAKKMVNKIEPNPYEIIIAREVRNWFDSSKMIAICHKNAMSSEEQFELAVSLRKANMYIKKYGRQVMRLALEGSPYAATLPLFLQDYYIIFSPDINVPVFEKIVKKCPQITLLAGILEGHVLNKEDFLRYGKLDLTSSRVHLVQILQNAGGNNLNQQLTHHQSTLVARLKQIGTNETALGENENSQSV